MLKSRNLYAPVVRKIARADWTEFYIKIINDFYKNLIATILIKNIIN